MVCEHLRVLEEELLASGIEMRCRGKVWSDNCREWVYFNCVLDLKSLRGRIGFDPCVRDHEHTGTHDGNESGLFCVECKDGIMGFHPKFTTTDIKIFR